MATGNPCRPPRVLSAEAAAGRRPVAPPPLKRPSFAGRSLLCTLRVLWRYKELYCAIGSWPIWCCWPCRHADCGVHAQTVQVQITSPEINRSCGRVPIMDRPRWTIPVLQDEYRLASTRPRGRDCQLHDSPVSRPAGGVGHHGYPERVYSPSFRPSRQPATEPFSCAPDGVNSSPTERRRRRHAHRDADHVALRRDHRIGVHEPRHPHANHPDHTSSRDLAQSNSYGYTVTRPGGG